MDSNTGDSSDSKDVSKLRRVRIQSLKEVHSVEEPTNPEVEFIIQVSIILCEAVLLFYLYCSHISVLSSVCKRVVKSKFMRHISIYFQVIY